MSNIDPFSLLNVDLSSKNTSIKIGINSNAQQTISLAVVNVSGVILYSKAIQLQKGFNAIENKVPAFNTGVYYVSLLSNDKVVTTAVLSH